MKVYSGSGLAHAASRGVRRCGSDIRTAMALEMIVQIEQEYRRWLEMVGQHPADLSASRRILQQRSTPGAEQALTLDGARAQFQRR